MSAATFASHHYRQRLWGTLDLVSRNCLLAAGAFGVAVIIAVFVAPTPPPRQLTIQEMPERFARLILEQPQPLPETPEPVAPTIEAPRAPGAPPVQTATRPAPPEPQPVTRQARQVERRPEPKVAKDKGQRGRKQARTEVAANLSEVSGSLDKVLNNLSQALPAAGDAKKTRTKPRRRQRRGVRDGRAGTQLAAVNNIDGLARAETKGTALVAEGISIAAITELETDGDTAAGTGGRDGGGGDIRSNQDLLNVVRRYAPGIQFCYENELKKSPGLRGKLIVSLTVAADGTVSDAILVENTLGSPAVTDCVLAQMRGWQFPAIAAGRVTFQTPFVFTPPD